jgi:hypothetical protein
MPRTKKAEIRVSKNGKRLGRPPGRPRSTIKPVRPIPGLNVVQMLETRGSKYGPFIGHAEVTRALKNVIHFYVVQRKGSMQNLEADMAEALDMIAHKIARIINGDETYSDSWADIAGYAKLVADRLEGTTR